VFQLFRFSAFRRSDTPLAPPVCLRLVDRHFWIRLGSIRASRVVLGALAEQLFLISDLWSLISGSGRGTKRGLCGTITLVNKLAVWSNPQEWKSTTFSDTTGERAPRVLVLAPKRTSDNLIFDSGFSR
jgi:hypothetical protein